MSAMEYVKTGKEEKKKCIAQALEKVGLYGIEQQKICQLSGGEQQRVALAKLMVKPCELILTDEPTGNLDEENRDIVFSILRDLNQKGKTVVWLRMILCLRSVVMRSFIGKTHIKSWRQ